MNKLKQIIDIFKETHYKMKEIKIEEKRVSQYFDIVKLVEKLYKDENEIEIKKISLYIQQSILNIAKHHNNKTDKLLNEFNIYRKEKQCEISHVFDKDNK